MKSAQVNATVARDLVSHASAKVADLNDFTAAGAAEPDSKKNMIASPQSRQNAGATGEEDLRSLKSEYDYGSKKKFVDVLGNISIGAKLRGLRARHELEKATASKGASKVGGGAGSLMKESSNSRVASYKTYSKTTKTSKSSMKSWQSHLAALNRTGQQPALAGPIQEEALDEEGEADEYAVRPADFANCTNGGRLLTEDEKIVAARVVNEALQAGRDIPLDRLPCDL